MPKNTKLPGDQQSRLLALPDELLLIIIECAVVEPDLISLSGRHHGGCKARKPWIVNSRKKPRKCWDCPPNASDIQPAISRVNRFFRFESLKLYYQKNTFYNDDPDHKRVLLGWLTAIGPVNREMLTGLYICSNQICRIVGIEHMKDGKEAQDASKRCPLQIWYFRKFGVDCTVPGLQALGAEIVPREFEDGKRVLVTFPRRSEEEGLTVKKYGGAKRARKKAAKGKGRVDR